MGHVRGPRVASDRVIHCPEAYGDAVAAHESVLVGREPDETALAGDRLIEPAQVQSASARKVSRWVWNDHMPLARGAAAGAWRGRGLPCAGARGEKGIDRVVLIRKAGHGDRRRQDAKLLARAPPSWAIATPAPVKISTPIDTIFVSLFTTLYFCV